MTNQEAIKQLKELHNFIMKYGSSADIDALDFAISVLIHFTPHKQYEVREEE